MNDQVTAEDNERQAPWRSIPDLVERAAGQYGDAEAVTDGGLSWSWQELAAQVSRCSRALIDLGIETGDRVAIWAPNTPEWIVAALGTLAAGGVLVPLNTRYKGHEAHYILGKSRARLLFTVQGFLGNDYVGMLADAVASEGELPLEHQVVLRGDVVEGTLGYADVMARGEAVPEDLATERSRSLGPDDVSDIMFTSGTTGRPKGVVSTHGQTLRTFETWSRLVGLAEGDRYLIVNPFFHTFGYKAGIVSAVMRGATIVPHAVFDPDTVLPRIAEERISMLPGPPALYQALLNHPDLGSHDLSSLRLAVTGAATIPVSLIERMSSELGFDTVLTAYGLTEATGVVTMCREGDDAETIANTSGRAIPDVDVKVVDDDGNQLPPGEPGEVVVRGYNVMRGYFEDEEQTAAAIRDGWLHTGDIGVMDERGYLDITDRKKDMFIVGGFNAYPAEIENTLTDHPDVAQVAVVGMPDERLGEVGCAFVVATSGTTPDEDAIVAWSRERMANFKVPRRVVVVEGLPTNASGKVLKTELRQRAAQLASEDA